MDVLDQPIRPEQFRVNRYPASPWLIIILAFAPMVPIILILTLLIQFEAPSGFFLPLLPMTIFVTLGLQYMVRAECIIRVSAQGFRLVVTKPGFRMPLSETFTEWSMLTHFQTGYNGVFGRFSSPYSGRYLTIYFLNGQAMRFANGELSWLKKFLKLHFPDKQKAWWDWD